MELTRPEVLEKVASGALHPQSCLAALHNITSREVANFRLLHGLDDRPAMMVGLGSQLPAELAEELFGPEPSQDEQ